MLSGVVRTPEGDEIARCAMTDAVYSKGQVNRAGERLRDDARGHAVPLTGRELEEARQVVEHWRGLHARPLSAVAAGLRYYVAKAGADERSVSQRLKRYSTIIEKLERHPGTLTQMEDIGGVRAVLPDQDAVDTVVASLKKRWNIRRVREYIDGRTPGPKDDGYRAVHVIVVKDDRFVEIQLRTPSQDRWAQTVERDTRRLGEALKFGGGPQDLRTYFRLVAEVRAAREAGRDVDLETLREMSRWYHATAGYYDSGDDVT
jgi:ppGpp synthetase/RelA/SpoT-type nucleotidyltranferase